MTCVCFIWCQEVSGELTEKKLPGIDRLRLASRPASDTDDTMWEELLQGPDSASSGSSDSEGSVRYKAGMNLPEDITPSSEDEGLQQGFTSVNMNLFQNHFLVAFVCIKTDLISEKEVRTSSSRLKMLFADLLARFTHFNFLFLNFRAISTGFRPATHPKIGLVQ